MDRRSEGQEVRRTGGLRDGCYNNGRSERQELGYQSFTCLALSDEASTILYTSPLFLLFFCICYFFCCNGYVFSVFVYHRMTVCAVCILSSDRGR